MKTYFRHCMLFLITLILYSTFVPCHASGSEQGDIFNNILKEAIYKKEYANQSLNVSTKQLNFIIDNFTYLIDLILQSEPNFFNSIFNGQYFVYTIPGEPNKFIIRSPNNKAEFIMNRIHQNQIVYHGFVETLKFKIPISVDFAVKVNIQNANANAKNCKVDFAIALKPQSEIMTTALKPFQKTFSSYADEGAAYVLKSTNGFFAVLHTKISAYLTIKDMLPQISKL